METRLHAKCLRSTEAVRDYFRRYRAARKGGDRQSNSEPAPVAPTKPDRHGSARQPAPPQEEPPMDPVALIAQHNARIAEMQAQQTQAQHTRHNRPMLLLRPWGGGGPPPVATASVCSNAGVGGAGAGARAAAFRGSSGGGSASYAWNEFAQGPEDAGAGATPRWRAAAPSRSLESAGLYSQVSAMECSPMRVAARGSGGGAADMLTPFHAPPTPMSVYTGAPSPFRPPPTPMSGYRGAPSPLTLYTTPMRAPPGGIRRDWFAGADDAAGGGGDAGYRARVLTWDEAAADGAVCGLQQQEQEQAPGGEKRRSDRSSATDDGAGSSSMHRGGEEGEDAGSELDGCSETESETETETETDNDGDDEEQEGRWVRQQPLRRVDTPFWGRRAKSLTSHLTPPEHHQHFELQQQQQQQRHHHHHHHQQPQPMSGLQGGAMSRQLPSPLQLPVGDAMLTSPLPYLSYTAANINNNNNDDDDVAWRGGAPPLVRCGDQRGLALLLRQQKQQQRELVLREQAMGRADSLSPGSLLITAPALPIMPLREDDWLVSPGSGMPLGQDSSQQQKGQQRQRPPPQQAQQPEHIAAAAAAGGGMARIDEGMEEMEGDGDDDDDDDDEGVPEVFWDD
ncbi:hypothetical protein PLESTB_001566600 [Pleodorina starrii]|uniref:Uncharacterized protein n=1 Tax=Pleodorina starrii TaxID=330485 RepID=A0A9W6BXI1_9CHLO|nr:hypothetical protein PLESTB_001566600 [Pleodorina starrii]